MNGSFNARIRMYRQGIGDCLLVQLPRDDGRQPFRMVIDCGVVIGTPDAKKVMEKVVLDLQRATGGDPETGARGTIDVLAITHEHWDHISGFARKDDWTDRFTVRQVWAAWTEDPSDEQALLLDKAKKTALDALTSASHALGLAGAKEAGVVNQLLTFYGVGAVADEDVFGARATTRICRDNALSLAGKDNVNYLQPGGLPLRLDGVDTARVFVLGPPRGKKLLKKADPSKKTPETYHLKDAEDLMFGTRLVGASFEPGRRGPFSAAVEIPLKVAEQVDFFRKHYFNAETSATDRQDDGPPDDDTYSRDGELDTVLRDESWRRIDTAWAGNATDLAMKLDKATNNTSLVLAIELKRDGGVLLFPGDAQVGNWLSWHEVEWDGDGSGVTARDLLRRTRVYKVGHHGSHNATLRDKGLELMDANGLIALLPVDHQVAIKKGWEEMPLKVLTDRLLEQANGRLLRADNEDFPAKPKTRRVRKSTWENFVKNVTVPPAAPGERPLYFEVEI